MMTIQVEFYRLSAPLFIANSTDCDDKEDFL